MADVWRDSMVPGNRPRVALIARHSRGSAAVGGTQHGRLISSRALPNSGRHGRHQPQMVSARLALSCRGWVDFRWLTPPADHDAALPVLMQRSSSVDWIGESGSEERKSSCRGRGLSGSHFAVAFADAHIRSHDRVDCRTAPDRGSFLRRWSARGIRRIQPKAGR